MPTFKAGDVVQWGGEGPTGVVVAVEAYSQEVIEAYTRWNGEPPVTTQSVKVKFGRTVREFPDPLLMHAA